MCGDLLGLLVALWPAFQPYVARFLFGSKGRDLLNSFLQGDPL